MSHIAILQRGTNGAAADDLAIVRQRIDSMDGETTFLTQLRQKGGVALTLMAQCKIMADPQLAQVEMLL